MLEIASSSFDQKLKQFCNNFINSNNPKYIFGRNEFAESIARHIHIDGYIDEYTTETKYLNKPIVKIDEIPENALVVIAVAIGKPLVAEKKALQHKLNFIDYYSFLKYSGLELEKIPFWEGFTEDFSSNRTEYENIYNKLSDNESKKQYQNIINFRLSYNLDFMRSFKAIEDKQYFEPFLDLDKNNETFVDIGGFDGYTSLEFTRIYPGYNTVHLFEPEEKNLFTAKRKLQNHKNINFYKLGLSNTKQTLKFDTDGSSSKISEDGNIIINVDRLDDIIDSPVSFIKMDIEGAERNAIEGAENTINKYHPTLAICVYHRFDDFWRIPKLIFSIRNDYNIYLRHYTEGISETVMFFIPK